VISNHNRAGGRVNRCNQANIVELGPNDTSGGYGSLPSEDGGVQSAAGCVHGPSRSRGVAGVLEGIKTPSTDRMMLAGAGAPWQRVFPENDGEPPAVTTTRELRWKMAGRCGDSPISGGGLWAVQEVGGAGSTGSGEEYFRFCGAHTILEDMKREMPLKRVSRNFNDDKKRLDAVDWNFYALSKTGEYAGGSPCGGRRGMWPRPAMPPAMWNNRSIYTNGNAANG
jgi:isoaspartyl peptidase/L-asparaginase-like protein (Ntn-hydrolase superfamily)